MNQRVLASLRHPMGGAATPKQAQGVDGRPTEYGDPGFSRFLRRAFLASAGFDGDSLERPVVGIAHTSSDYATCHRSMPELVEAVRRGVLEAGALPLAFPTASLPEILLSPTSMLLRNLLAMETEQLVTMQPMDAVVMLGGCDKTVPAQLMAAASANVPAILVVTGPMLAGEFRGEPVGACTDCRRLWADHRAGRLDADGIAEAQQALCPTAGTCMVMGTASTMACIAETLGMMLPGGATAPAVSSERLRHAVAAGRHAAELASAGAPTPRDVLTPAAFRNALTVLAAVGGSTNAVVHLLAIARRAGVPLALDDIDAVAREVPLLVDCKPSGSGYVEHFHRAGGVPALLRELAPLLGLDTVGVTGTALRDLIVEAPAPRTPTIRTLADPLGDAGSLAVVRGSLAPDGAVIKVSAASAHLLVHTGPAVVFDSPEDAAARIDEMDLTADHVMVLRGAGPVAMGMPEAGSLPIPTRLAEAGVRDMVRISDGRMSGTAYGTVVLHVSPESAVGGPLALVRDGDLVSLDVPNRRLDLLVEEAEMARRRAEWVPPPAPGRGWPRLFAEHVEQAHLGADLDFC